MRRGQASVEFLAIVAFGLLVLTPLLMYLMTSTPYNEYKSALISAESSLQKIRDECELVAAQPPGTSKVIEAQIPLHTQTIKFTEKGLIIIKTAYAGLDNDIVVKGFPKFENKEIKLNGGGYVIRLKVTNEGDYLKVEKI